MTLMSALLYTLSKNCGFARMTALAGSCVIRRSQNDLFCLKLNRNDPEFSRQCVAINNSFYDSSERLLEDAWSRATKDRMILHVQEGAMPRQGWRIFRVALEKEFFNRIGQKRTSTLRSRFSQCRGSICFSWAPCAQLGIHVDVRPSLRQDRMRDIIAYPGVMNHVGHGI
jgi:hypothetical protein